MLLVESLALSAAVGLVTLGAPRFVSSHPKSLRHLKASMAVTALAVFLGGLALIVGVSEFIASYYGYHAAGSTLVAGVAVFLAILMILQWLFSPYLINAVYRTRPPRTSYEVGLQVELERIARSSGVKPPRLRIAPLWAPNAFAYGSPLAGNYVAVTQGLLESLPREEVIAVLGHEVGHLKHRDVAWILSLSLIPLAVYFLGRSLLWAGLLGGGRREERSSPLVLLAVGVALITVSILFRFIVAHFNRLREYYADAHSALVTGQPRLLQRALARIHLAIRGRPEVREELQSHSLALQLFIVAPLIELSGGFYVDIDELVEELKRVEPDPLEELFSTHPPVPKRLKFLDALSARLP
ncbi:zinc metalloprotease HtpX [Stetteria hydrogenophila]